MSPQISQEEIYCTGQELVDAWGIHPSQLSLCMILGLQPYSKKVCRPLFDPVPLTESVKDAAWRTLTEFTGKDGPKRFQGNAPPPGGLDWMPYRLFGAAVTIDELIRQHLDCLFRTDDALKFQSEFGLDRNVDSTGDSETRISENFKEKEPAVADWKRIIKSALPEVGKLYQLTTSKEQIPNGITNTDNLPAVFKEKALLQLKEHPWSYIAEEDLAINYAFSVGKERRDFAARVLHRILGRRGFDIRITTIRETLS